MAVFSTDCAQLRCYASKHSNWLIFTNARVTQFMDQYLTFYGRVSLLTAELTHNTYSVPQPTVALDPDGVARVCIGQNQQFMCTSGGVSWTISGFGNGISDASLDPAVDYAANNIRVTTTDSSTLSNPSTLTFMMLGYPDDNAIVTCTNAARTRMITSTIRIGESAFMNVRIGVYICNCHLHRVY